MTLRRLMASRPDFEGWIYILIALVWAVVQIANAAARKRKSSRAAGPPPPPLRPPTPRPVAPPKRESAPPEEDLREFLRELTGFEPPPARAPVPPPRPRVPAPARTRRPPPRAAGPAVRFPPPPAPVMPGDRDLRRSFSRSAESIRAAAGAALKLRSVRFPKLPVMPMRGMGTGAAARDAGDEIRAVFQGERARQAARDAMIWKTVLDMPIALLPPGGGALWDPGNG